MILIIVIIIPKIIIIVATSLVELADHIHAHTAEGVRACDAHIGVVVLQVNLGGGGNYHKIVGSKHRKLRGFSERSHEGRTKVAREVARGLCLNYT